jgi:hypothetical protein
VADQEYAALMKLDRPEKLLAGMVVVVLLGGLLVFAGVMAWELMTPPCGCSILRL